MSTTSQPITDSFTARVPRITLFLFLAAALAVVGIMVFPYAGPLLVGMVLAVVFHPASASSVASGEERSPRHYRPAFS